MTFRVYVSYFLSVKLIAEGNIVNHSTNLFSMYNTASWWEDGGVQQHAVYWYYHKKVGMSVIADIKIKIIDFSCQKLK